MDVIYGNGNPPTERNAFREQILPVLENLRKSEDPTMYAEVLGDSYKAKYLRLIAKRSGYKVTCQIRDGKIRFWVYQKEI